MDVEVTRAEFIAIHEKACRFELMDEQKLNLLSMSELLCARDALQRAQRLKEADRGPAASLAHCYLASIARIDQAILRNSK